MPQIKKVRVANIKYDHNKKQMPDITFNLDNKDSIFLLANGGGKSLLVQLILQAILPNQAMGKRRIADLFQSASYTGHVALEWVLDSGGEEEHFLCTGFCFTEGRGNQKIDYYNYLIDYTAKDNFAISSLPFIKDKNLFSNRQPIKFQELKDWLYEQEDYRIEVFDKNYKYKNRLKQYGILAKQWESIAKTNAAEGGVDDFFARSKTASQLLNNLLIPQIKDVLFATDDKDQLFAAFSQHRTKLLRMPKIKANIKQFGMISEQAEALIDDVEKLDDLQQKNNREKLALVSLAKRFKINISEAKERLSQLEETRDELLETETKLAWQKDSYPIFLKNLAQQELEQKKEANEEKLQRLEEKLAVLESEKRKLLALRLYNKAEIDKQEAEKYQQRLNNLDKKSPQLKAELQKTKKALVTAWQEQKNSLVNKEASIKDKLAQLAEEIKSTASKLEQQEEVKDKLITQKTLLNNWFDDFNNKEEKIKNKLELNSLENPAKLIKAKEEEIANSKRKVKQLKNSIEKSEQKREELGEREVRLKQQETELEAELNNLKQQLAEFSAAQKKLQGMLASKGRYYNDLLNEKEEVFSFGRENLAGVRRNKDNLAAGILNLEEKKTLLTDKEYYVPQRELLKIKDFLAKQDIYTVLGSEWLAEQRINEPGKQDYLKAQPLLPYAVIIEKSQLVATRRALQSYDLAADFPIILILRKKLVAAKEEELATGLNIILQEELFVSKQSFQQFKDNLIEKISVKQEELEQLKEEEDFFIDLRGMINDFYTDYSQERLLALKKEKEENQLKQKDLAADLDGLAKEKSDLKEALKVNKQRLEKSRQKSDDLKYQLKELKDFNELFKLKETKRKHLVEVLDDLALAREELLNLKESKEELNAEMMASKEQLKRIYQQQELHQTEYDDFQLAGVEARKEDVDKSYQQIKNSYQDLAAQLNQKQGQRKDIEQLLKKIRLHYQEKQKRIEELAIDFNWLDKNQRQVAEAEIKGVKGDYQSQQQKVSKQEKRLREIKDDLIALSSKIEAMSENIAEKYKREVYLNFSDVNHQRELTIISDSLVEIRAEIKEIKGDIITVKERQRENQTALEDLKYELGAEFEKLEHQIEALSKKRWQQLALAPKELLRKQQKELKSLESDLMEQKQKVAKNFQSYVVRLKNSQTPQVRQFIKNVEQIMQQGKIYDYDYVESRFLNMLEAFSEYKKNYQHELAENKRNMEHLAKRSFRRAKIVYENIIELPKNSRIELYDRKLQVIKIDWEAVLGQQGEDKIYNYLEKVIKDLQQLKEEGADDDDLDKKMRERLMIKNLINILAPIEECRIRVLKPRPQEVMEESKLDYSDWSEVARWSGGESYSVYMAMFMIMVSYIRKQIEGRSDVSKTIIADNPFGKASSGHILDTVFEIARANKIQLLCLTAHRQEDILLRFPIAYSLKLRSAYGKEVLQHDKLESGFYNLEG